MPRVEWPLHIYRGYLERMANHLRSDQLLGHKYMEGFSAGFQSALEALDMHVAPCSCDICVRKQVGEIDPELSTDQITAFKPVVGRLSSIEPNVILDSTDTEAIESLNKLNEKDFFTVAEVAEIIKEAEKILDEEDKKDETEQ